jgi:uncharacterized protein YdiU (UPF0061 family)
MNKDFLSLAFTAAFTRSLPGEASADNRPRQVTRACWSHVEPAPVSSPSLLLWSESVASSLGIDPATPRDPRVAEVLAGNRLLPGMYPWAAAYAGHQFGHWAGQLGDGRAITLGEVADSQGRAQELQLKGAGPTPYSRHADGRAVLRSSLREFLCSEAMHGLGIPTTRALSLVATGDLVVRDMFYDGHPRAEPGAIVCRVAPSFIRFGNFQLHAARGEVDILRRLADYVIDGWFPDAAASGAARYREWFADTCRRTAQLMVDWMRTGFIHGVMNTDNMSILGLTIDYGPYGWLEPFEPDWTPNTTDAEGRRYCYGRQPQVALWNLARLAESLRPLGLTDAELQDGLDDYTRHYEGGWRAMMNARLGLPPGPDSQAIAEALPQALDAAVDLTLFHRQLARVPLQGDDELLRLAPLRGALYDTGAPGPALCDWLGRYVALARTAGQEPEARRRAMDQVNPLYVLRNWLAQQAIDAAEQGELAPARRLLRVLRRPYEEQPGEEDLAMQRPEWARDRPGCSALSCSS